MRYEQKCNRGDGIKAGVWAGGEKDEFPSAMVFDRGPVKPGGKAGVPIKAGATFDSFFMASQPFMKVNMDGKRFTSESVPYDIVLYPLQDQKNGVSCIIWDSNYWKHIRSFDTIGCSRMIKSNSSPKTLEGMGFFPNYILMTLYADEGDVKKIRNN